MRRGAGASAAICAALASRAAAQGAHDALAPAGPQAGRIAWLVNVNVWVAAIVLALVLLALAVALLALRRGPGPPEVEVPPTEPAEPEQPIAPPDPARERRRATAVAIATGATVLVLGGLLVASVEIGRAVDRFGADAALEVNVIGHQWWWEIQYLDPQASNIATTANELHVPAGRPVRIHLESRDVIHSFWVPSLHGKTDLIPGKRNTIVIQADHPGVHRGQCAEFCGAAHAKMGILVIAEDEAAFQAWLAHQRAPAAEPRSDLARRGRDVFVRGACAMCHTVRGTAAGATAGPDLTHVGGRRTLGAGTLPNVRGHRAGWIANSQSAKPGNHMPAVSLPPDDLEAVVTWLEDLE